MSSVKSLVSNSGKISVDKANLVKAISNLSTRVEDYGPATLDEVDIYIDKNLDSVSEENRLNIRELLIDSKYIEIDGEVSDKERKVTGVKECLLKEDLDFKEPFVLPEEDLKKTEIAGKFAEYLTSALGEFKAVRLDPSKNELEIWWFDTSARVWHRGGESRVGELLLQNLPEEHSSYLEKETKLKVKRINPISLDEVGAEVGEIAVKNGLLELDELNLNKIERKDYITSKLPVKYKEDVGEPTKFLDFLHEVTEKEEDVQLLQEFVGYCLMEDSTKYEKALILLGPTDSGKTVFLNVVRELLGSENIAQESLKNLTDRKNFRRSNLVGKLANIDHDLNPDKIENLETAKKLISGNPLSVESKWEKSFDYTPAAKHMFSANQAPSREREDEAFYNRWLTVPFPKSVPREEQDPDLIDELTTEKELRKILCWAVEGYQRLEQQEEFTGDNSPIANKELWKRWGHSVERFISNYTITRRQKVKQLEKEGSEDPHDIKLRVHTETLYRLYQKYCTAEGREVKSKKELSREIAKLKGVSRANYRTEEGRRRGFKGIELISNANQKIKERLENENIW